MTISFNINIDRQSNTLKYQQLADSVVNAISEGSLSEGEMLPSVNDLLKHTALSRDTVFKAYSELKARGIVESVPNRGYFVARQMNRVLLFLDTFKAYKEVLYDAFRENLPENIAVDLHFHHYNFEVFKTILEDSVGRYSHYIIMNFDHPHMAKTIDKIPTDKLLVIDWNIHAKMEHSYVCQDFGQSLFENLEANLEKIRTYKRFIYLYPEKWTYHPKTSLVNFEKFCSQFNINGEVLYNQKKVNIQKGDLFLLVSDRTLTMILDHLQDNNLEMGKDVGIISYNDTPMKKYIKEGISVISTNFTEMGQKAAEFVLSAEGMQHVVPTSITSRKSF